MQYQIKLKKIMQMKTTIKFNRRKKTYTIRKYDEKGKLYAKYRSLPQGKDYSENWTESDINYYLSHNYGDYYKV